MPIGKTDDIDSQVGDVTPDTEDNDDGYYDDHFCLPEGLKTSGYNADTDGVVKVGVRKVVEFTTPTIQGEQWRSNPIPEGQNYRTEGMSGTNLARRFKKRGKVPTVFAFDRGGKEREYHYAVGVREAARAVIDARMNNPVKVDKDGYYYDEGYDEESGGQESKIWCTINAFFKTLKPEVKERTSQVAIRRYAKKSCKSMAALDSWGRLNDDNEVLARVYPLEELKKLPIVTSEIRVDPETGIYTDENGEEWASRRTWVKVCGVIPRALDKGISQTFGSVENMTTLKGFGNAKRMDDLYCEAEIIKALAYIFEAEHLSVDDVTTTIEEVNGGVHETIYLSQKELVTLFPEEEVPRYRYPRVMKKEGRVDSVDRSHGGNVPSFEIKTIQRTFSDRINTVLESEVQPEEAHGQVLTLEEYFTLNPETLKDKDQILISLDMVARFRQISEDGRIRYTYPEKELDQIAKAA